MSAPAPATAPISAKHVAAVSIGNALAFYDFLAYFAFAVQIGHSFLTRGLSPKTLQSVSLWPTDPTSVTNAPQ